MKRLLLLSSVLACFAFLPIKTSAQDGWQKIYPNTIKLYHALSADSVFVVDRFDLMLTTDGGASWNKKGAIPWLNDSSDGSTRIVYTLNSLFFLDGAHGLLTGSSLLQQVGGSGSSDVVPFAYMTTNGGVSWTPKAMPEEVLPVSPITAVYRISGSKAFAFGYSVYNHPERNFLLNAANFIYDGDSLIPYYTPRPWIANAVAVHDTTVVELLGLNGPYGSAFRRRLKDTAWTDLGKTLIWPIEYLAKDVLISYESISRDDGDTWEPAGITPGLVYANGRGVGIAATATDWLKTVDTGKTWHSFPNPQGISNLTVFDSSLIYGIGYPNLLYKTGSGGWKLNVMYSPSASLINVYPNPASNSVISPYRLTWHDQLGRVHSPSSEQSVDGFTYDVSALSAGSYTVRHGDRSQLVIVRR
jgi:hypothetical protein